MAPNESHAGNRRERTGKPERRWGRDLGRCFRRCRGEPGELKRNRRRRHGLPRAERPLDLALELRRRYARDAPIGGPPAKTRRVPFEAHRPARRADGEMKIRFGRRRAERQQAHERQGDGAARSTCHGRRPMRARTCSTNAATSSGRLAGSPRTMRPSASSGAATSARPSTPRDTRYTP